MWLGDVRTEPHIISPTDRPTPFSLHITQQLGQSAKFRMTSLEAKVVVHFGSQLEHYVRVPLHNKVHTSLCICMLWMQWMQGRRAIPSKEGFFLVCLLARSTYSSMVHSPPAFQQYKEAEMQQLSNGNSPKPQPMLGLT